MVQVLCTHRLSSFTILSSSWNKKKLVCFPQLEFTKIKIVSTYLPVYLIFSRDPKEIVRPRIPLSACIESFAADETVEDFYSSALKAKTLAKK